jgi:hypothetical protein
VTLTGLLCSHPPGAQRRVLLERAGRSHRPDGIAADLGLNPEIDAEPIRAPAVTNRRDRSGAAAQAGLAGGIPAAPPDVA